MECFLELPLALAEVDDASFAFALSQMGAYLALAMLAELCRPCFLWDLFIRVPRHQTLLGTSLGASGGR